MSNDQKNSGDDQLQALLDAVEELREARFPTLDAALVREILQLHASGMPADTETSRMVERAVEMYLGRENPAC